MLLNDPQTMINSRATAATMQNMLAQARVLRRGQPSRLDEKVRHPGDDFKNGAEEMCSAHAEFVKKNEETSIRVVSEPAPEARTPEVVVPEYKKPEQEDGDPRA